MRVNLAGDLLFSRHTHSNVYREAPARVDGCLPSEVGLAQPSNITSPHLSCL